MLARLLYKTTSGSSLVLVQIPKYADQTRNRIYRAKKMKAEARKVSMVMVDASTEVCDIGVESDGYRRIAERYRKVCKGKEIFMGLKRAEC